MYEKMRKLIETRNKSEILMWDAGRKERRKEEKKRAMSRDPKVQNE